MLSGITNPDSAAGELKTGMSALTQRVRTIGHRVANASNPDFQAALEAAGEAPVDVDREMVDLADAQLRYEAAAALLQKVYQQIRSSVREG